MQSLDGAQAWARALAIDHGLSELRARHQALTLSYIDLPRATGQALRVRLGRSDGQSEESWAELDPVSGALLTVRGDSTNLHAVVKALLKLRLPPAYRLAAPGLP